MILEEVRSDSSPPSQGGNVHPLTSPVLAFMEGLLAYEDTATIIASIYVEQDQSKRIEFSFSKIWSLSIWLEINSVGLSGSEKGLYDLGTYFCKWFSWKLK